MNDAVFHLIEWAAVLLLVGVPLFFFARWVWILATTNRKEE